MRIIAHNHKHSIILMDDWSIRIIDNQQLEKFLKNNQSPWTNSKSMIK